MYPFFPSGVIAITDGDSGLYLAQDQTRTVAQGSLSFLAESAALVEGQPAQIAVQRTSGTSGAVSVDVEIVAATADSGEALIAASTLSWVDGDSADKFIDISASNDGVGESLEHLFVRLINPVGGATLGNLNVSSVYLSDAGAAAEIRFAETSIEIAETGFATLVAVLQRTGSATGAVSVDYAQTAGDATEGTDFQGTTSGTINWADGDASPNAGVFC